MISPAVEDAGFGLSPFVPFTPTPPNDPTLTLNLTLTLTLTLTDPDPKPEAPSPNAANQTFHREARRVSRGWEPAEYKGRRTARRDL